MSVDMDVVGVRAAYLPVVRVSVRVCVCTVQSRLFGGVPETDWAFWGRHKSLALCQQLKPQSSRSYTSTYTEFTTFLIVT